MYFICSLKHRKILYILFFFDISLGVSEYYFDIRILIFVIYFYIWLALDHFWATVSDDLILAVTRTFFFILADTNYIFISDPDYCGTNEIIHHMCCSRQFFFVPCLFDNNSSPDDQIYKKIYTRAKKYPLCCGEEY